MPADIELLTLKCKFCGYEWIPRVSNPKVCPKCKYYLDWPTRTKKAATAGVPE